MRRFLTESDCDEKEVEPKNVRLQCELEQRTEKQKVNENEESIIYKIKDVINSNDITPEKSDDDAIRNQIKFDEYKQIFNKHNKIIKEWNINSDNLQNAKQQIVMKTYDFAEEQSQDDEEKDDTQNSLYTKQIEMSKMIQEQTKRLHQVGTNDHIMQLIDVQHRLSVK